MSEYTSHTEIQRKPLALISNPLSYTNRRRGGQALAVIEEQIRQAGGQVWRVHDGASLEAAVNEAIAGGSCLLVANGGDGTIHGVVSAVLRHYGDQPAPAIAVLPGGRTNVIAADLGLRGAPASFIPTLIQAWNKGQLRFSTRATLAVSQSKQPQRFGFLMNGGGLARLIEECWAFRERYKSWGLYGGFGTGVWVVGRIVSAVLGRALFRPERAHCHWRAPGQSEALWCDSLAAFSLTTNEKLPLGVSPYAEAESQAEIQASRFKGTAINGEARRVVWRILAGLLGRGAGLDQASGFKSGWAESIRIQADEAMRYHFDGESYPLAQGEELLIQRGPDLRLVQWPPQA